MAKQYCRYCIHLHVNNYPYCDVKEMELKEYKCKKPNDCKDYVFADCEPEYQDAFGETRGYIPRAERHSKQCEGQIRFEV